MLLVGMIRANAAHASVLQCAPNGLFSSIVTYRWSVDKRLRRPYRSILFCTFLHESVIRKLSSMFSIMVSNFFMGTA